MTSRQFSEKVTKNTENNNTGTVNLLEMSQTKEAPIKHKENFCNKIAKHIEENYECPLYCVAIWSWLLFILSLFDMIYLWIVYRNRPIKESYDW